MYCKGNKDVVNKKKFKKIKLIKSFEEKQKNKQCFTHVHFMLARRVTRMIVSPVLGYRTAFSLHPELD